MTRRVQDDELGFTITSVFPNGSGDNMRIRKGAKKRGVHLYLSSLSILPALFACILTPYAIILCC